MIHYGRDSGTNSLKGSGVESGTNSGTDTRANRKIESGSGSGTGSGTVGHSNKCSTCAEHQRQLEVCGESFVESKTSYTQSIM